LTLQYIFHLVKEKGMTIQGAKKQLKLRKEGSSKQVILSKLEQIKSTLESLKENL